MRCQLRIVGDIVELNMFNQFGSSIVPVSHRDAEILAAYNDARNQIEALPRSEWEHALKIAVMKIHAKYFPEECMSSDYADNEDTGAEYEFLRKMEKEQFYERWNN